MTADQALPTQPRACTAHLTSEGIEQLLAPQDILDPAFRRHVDNLTSAEGKAAEIEHAIRHEIHVHRDEKPTAYQSLWEILEKLISERRLNRVSAASQLASLDEIATQAARARSGSSVNGGLSGIGGALLSLIELVPLHRDYDSLATSG